MQLGLIQTAAAAILKAMHLQEAVQVLSLAWIRAMTALCHKQRLQVRVISTSNSDVTTKHAHVRCCVGGQQGPLPNVHAELGFELVQALYRRKACHREEQENGDSRPQCVLALLMMTLISRVLGLQLAGRTSGISGDNRPPTSRAALCSIRWNSRLSLIAT
jgi:hypothetical protein